MLLTVESAEREEWHKLHDQSSVTHRLHYGAQLREEVIVKPNGISIFRISPWKRTCMLRQCLYWAPTMSWCVLWRSKKKYPRIFTKQSFLTSPRYSLKYEKSNNWYTVIKIYHLSLNCQWQQMTHLYSLLLLFSEKMQYDIQYIADKQINCQTYYLWKIIQKKKRNQNCLLQFWLALKG